MRFVKRAVRGDLHRFKAYVELDDEEKQGCAQDDRGRQGQARQVALVEQVESQSQRLRPEALGSKAKSGG